MIDMVHGKIGGKFNLKLALPATGNILEIIGSGSTTKNGIYMLSESDHVVVGTSVPHKIAYC